jgi:hypothetical protein
MLAFRSWAPIGRFANAFFAALIARCDLVTLQPNLRRRVEWFAIELGHKSETQRTLRRLSANDLDGLAIQRNRKLSVLRRDDAQGVDRIRFGLEWRIVGRSDGRLPLSTCIDKVLHLHVFSIRRIRSRQKWASVSF